MINTNNSFLNAILYKSPFFYSLRVLISLVGTVFIPWYLNDISLVIPTSLGVVAAATTDIEDRILGRLTNLLLIISCFLIASFSVSLLFPYPIAFFFGLILSTFAFILLGTISERYALIAMGSLLAAAYTMIGYQSAPDPYKLPIYLTIGVVWYNVVALVDGIIQPKRIVRESLSESFEKLADYLDCKAALFDPDENNHFKRQILALTESNKTLVDRLNKTKDVLFYQLRSYRGRIRSRKMLNYYFVVQDIHERASSSHGQYQTLSQQFRHSDVLFRFARILNLQAKACLSVATSIRQQNTYQHDPVFDNYFSYLHDAIQRLTITDRHIRLLQNSLFNLLHNLQSIDSLLRNIDSEQHLSELNKDDELSNDSARSIKEVYVRIKKNFTPKSIVFRHAVRMSIVLSAGYLVIQSTHLDHGYWIILTSLFVCQPNYSATKHRLRLRVIGTILGIVLGLPLTYLFPTVEAQLILIALSGWLFILFRSSYYAYATACITLMVFFSFGLIGESSESVAVARLIATLIGSAIAWLGVTFIWPDWKFRNLPVTIQKVYYNDCHYLALIGLHYLDGKSNDLEYRLSRRQAHESGNELSSLISTIAHEPHANKKQVEQGFRLLTLNHTLLSYISTLGAHRDKTISDATMSLFDEVTVFIVNALTHYKLKNGEFDSSGFDKNEYARIKQQLSALIENETTDNRNEYDLMVIQQFSLILDMLPELISLATELTKNQYKSTA